MSEHNICRGTLKSARARFKEVFKINLKLRVSRFKIIPSYSDYEVRLHEDHLPDDDKNFPKVFETSTCCSYDAKAKAVCAFLDEDAEYTMNKDGLVLRNID